MTNSLLIRSGDAAQVQNVANKVVRLGVTSEGTANEVYEYARGGDATIVSDLGHGEVVEETVQALRLTGGVDCVVVKVEEDIDGTIGTVTETPAGTSPAMTITGAPTMSIPRIAVKVTRAGALGEAQVAVALDGYDFSLLSYDVPEEAPGAVTGSVDLTGITLASLNTLTLVLTPDGGSNQTVTFTTPANIQGIADQINTQTTLMTASIVEGRYLRIVSDTVGASSSIQAQAASTADAIIGLDNTLHQGSVAAIELTGTGLTLTFPSGTYLQDVVYSAAITGPRFSVAAMEAALDALKASGVEPGVIEVCQDPLDAQEAVSLYNALKAKLAAWRSADAPWYVKGIVRMPLGGTSAADMRTNDLAVRTAFNGITDELGVVTRAHGDCYTQGSFVKGSHRRSIAVPLSIRAAGASLSEDPGSGEMPSLPEVSLVGPDGETKARQEPTASVKMEASGFTVLEARGDLPYFAGGETSAPSGSKFRDFGIVRAALYAARVAWQAMLAKKRIRRDLTPQGKLQPRDLKNLEKFYRRQLADALLGTPRHASAVSATIPDAVVSNTTRYQVEWTMQHRARINDWDGEIIVTGTLVDDASGTTQTVA